MTSLAWNVTPVVTIQDSPLGSVLVTLGDSQLRLSIDEAQALLAVLADALANDESTTRSVNDEANDESTTRSVNDEANDEVTR